MQLNNRWTTATLFRSVCAAGALTFLMGADDTGCRSESSDSVNQDRVFTSYWLLYDGQADITYARAQFRLGAPGGTTLILQAPAAVAFDGRAMGFNELLDWHEVEIAGEVQQGTFSYVDGDGQRFTNVVSLAPSIGAPSDLPATLVGTESFELRWAGEPTGEDELIEVIVARQSNRFDFARFETRALGSSSLVLGADRLANVGRGPVVLSLRRHRDLPVTEAPSAGGAVLTTYQSLETTFTLQ